MIDPPCPNTADGKHLNRILDKHYVCVECGYCAMCNGEHKRRRAPKYHNVKKEVDGIIFDSIEESKMYQDLILLEKQGKIRDLRLQPEFKLIPGYTNLKGEKIRPLIYRADFMFLDLEERCVRVVDYKGCKTRVYKLKKKIFDYMYRKYDMFLEENIGRRSV
jgi:hypothetical protein